MKNYYSYIVILLFVGMQGLSAQVYQPLPIDCASNFWTIDANGYVQQWILENGTVSGGDTILSGGGIDLTYTDGVFCSNDFSQSGLTYFDTASTFWMNITAYPTPDSMDLYYQLEGAVIQVVKYWDGAQLVTIDSFNGEFFAGVQDVAVDADGQAWVFAGAAPSNVDSVKVYTKSRQINAYSADFSQIAYGSFFLNDTLYMGTQQDSIYPLLLNGTEIQLGNPIYFPTPGFTDMASCAKKSSTTAVRTYQNVELSIFPNPTKDQIFLAGLAVDANIAVYSMQGQWLEVPRSGSQLDFSQQPAGLYIVQVEQGGKVGWYKVVKE